MKTSTLTSLIITPVLLLASAYQQAWAEPTPELIYNLKGTIVRIHTATDRGGQGSGSGFVVAKNLVATNCHVLTNAIGVNIAALGKPMRLSVLGPIGSMMSAYCVLNICL